MILYYHPRTIILPSHSQYYLYHTHNEFWYTGAVIARHTRNCMRGFAYTSPSLRKPIVSGPPVRLSSIPEFSRMCRTCSAVCAVSLVIVALLSSLFSVLIISHRSYVNGFLCIIYNNGSTNIISFTLGHSCVAFRCTLFKSEDEFWNALNL
jgi:hypothetical protein